MLIMDIVNLERGLLLSAVKQFYVPSKIPKFEFSENLYDALIELHKLAVVSLSETPQSYEVNSSNNPEPPSIPFSHAC